MKKKKNDTRTWPKILLVGFILVIVLFIVNQSNPQTTNKASAPVVTPTLTQKQQMKNEITYSLPNGWREKSRLNSSPLEFVTEDYVEAYSIKGARIYIDKTVRTKSLRETMNEWAKNPQGPGAPIFEQINYTKVAGREAAVFPSCWEGCDLEYYIADTNETYRISFRCGTEPECSDPNGIKNTKYHPDFLSFIQSLKFK